MDTVRTFVVEDNPTIRENLIGTLREVARVDPVGQAESEQEGTRWLTGNLSQWDLAIVDLFLKDGTGFSVLEACRNREPTQKMVVLSNHLTPEMRRKCAQLGADAVFDKATEIDDLIDFCLRRRQEQFTASPLGAAH
jgi:two-component system OmpR family response regulator